MTPGGAMSVGGVSVMPAGVPPALGPLVTAPGLSPSSPPMSPNLTGLSPGGEAIPRGLVTPAQEALLSSRIAGQIQKIHFREGDHFKSGEPLVRFHCPVEKAALNKARAALRAADKKLAINRELIGVRSASRLEVEMAEADRLQAEAEVAMQSATVDMCTILAPFDGWVAALRVHPYESVAQGTPLVEIIGEGVLEVEVIIPSERIHDVRVGTPLSLKVQETGKSYPARVVRMEGRIDPVSQTVRLTGRFTEVHPDLLPGMSGVAELDRPLPP
ncbi:MAG: efflux RND transporter periplasmic adaptor subunit [Magnetococcales bacterium]|nr:efflux RND transporter periplasmic adaptor subunit [Magnetococcales bacterium]MBF0156659.1 efflux RND transporter periplasmic adaptor subunit [Magnetococcales bacterium]